MNRTKVTFAFLALACLAGAASAQFIGRTVTVAQLGACNGTRQVAVVTDATNATTLGAGGGNATVWATCATGSWTVAEIAAVADLSAYLPVSGTTASPIVIQNSGAGNDLSLIAIDDVIVTAADFLPTLSATAVITAPVTNIVATTSSTITTATLAAAVTTATVNAGGSTVELTVAAGSVRSGVAFAFPSAATLPTCDSTIAPAGFTAIYWDTTGPDLCACPEGVDWIAVDGSGTCA